MSHVPQSNAKGIARRLPDFHVIDDVYVRMFRAMTPAEKLDHAGNIWCYVRDIFLRSVWEEHPEWSFDEMAREVGRRMNALGDD